MGPIKDRYIHYEKVGDQFVGRSVPSIYLLITEFGVSLFHWYCTDSPVGSKYEMVALIEDNFVRWTYVSISTFNILQFLFAYVCFNLNHPNRHIHKNHRLRASPIFIGVGRAKYLSSFALNRYPWTSTTYTPYFAGIPLHVMLISDI